MWEHSTTQQDVFSSSNAEPVLKQRMGVFKVVPERQVCGWSCGKQCGVCSYCTTMATERCEAGACCGQHAVSQCERAVTCHGAAAAERQKGKAVWSSPLVKSTVVAGMAKREARQVHCDGICSQVGRSLSRYASCRLTTKCTLVARGVCALVRKRCARLQRGAKPTVVVDYCASYLLATAAQTT